MTQSLERVMARMLISDRLWLKSVFESVSTAILADGIVDEQEIETVEDFRKVHAATKRFVSAGMHTSDYPGLWDAVDREIDFAISGPGEVEITSDRRRQLIAALDKIAWAGLGGDG